MVGVVRETGKKRKKEGRTNPLDRGWGGTLIHPPPVQPFPNPDPCHITHHQIRALGGDEQGDPPAHARAHQDDGRLSDEALDEEDGVGRPPADGAGGKIPCVGVLGVCCVWVVCVSMYICVGVDVLGVWGGCVGVLGVWVCFCDYV